MAINVKLLVCDDDISTIDVIQSQLNCQELGIQCILRAYNGEAAIGIIERERPELILCDIGMPKVSGIEVLKYIYENGVYTEFAFLTCYEDFEYAREAVRYGATNYLTKPIDFDELNEALLRMISSVNEHLAQWEKGEDQSARDTMQNNVLRQIHDGFYGTNRDRIEKLLVRSGLACLEADMPVRLVMMEAETTKNSENGWERELLAYTYSHLAEEVLTGHIGCSSTIVNVGERYIWTTTFMRADQHSEEDCFQRAREFFRLCSLHLTLMPVCLIGDERPLYQAAAEAAELREQIPKVMLHGGSIYFLRDVRNITSATTSLIDEVQIMRMVKENDREKYLALVSGALEKISHSHSDNGSLMFLLHQDILQAFHSCLRDNNMPIRVLFQNEELRRLDRNANRSPVDMVNYASFLYDYVSGALRSKSEGDDIIGNVKRFIMAHYKEDIDRDAVAAVAYITPNYLSKRFRAEVGMSLREYINQLRIEEAKRLLLSTNATVTEVASEVGYDNISYFSTVFRKLCGMSPVEWCAGKRNGDGSK
jgi:two-component system response regulator YesN